MIVAIVILLIIIVVMLIALGVVGVSVFLWRRKRTSNDYIHDVIV